MSRVSQSGDDNNARMVALSLTTSDLGRILRGLHREARLSTDNERRACLRPDNAVTSAAYRQLAQCKAQEAA